MWIFLFKFTFLNGIVYKTTLTFMSSETLVENKLATISSLKSSNDVDLVRSYLRDIGRVPLLFDRMGLDPALMSSPFITTVTDIAGVFIYLSTANWLLDSSIL